MLVRQQEDENPLHRVVVTTRPGAALSTLLAQALPSAIALHPAGDAWNHLCHPASRVVLSWANLLGSLRLWCCQNSLSCAVTSNRDLLPEGAGICSGAFISDVHILSS